MTIRKTSENSVNERKAVMNKESQDTKVFFVLLSWGAFLITLILLVMSVVVKKEESLFLMGEVTVGSIFLRGVVLGCMAVLSLALAVHYTRAMLEKEHIRVDTYECIESELIKSIILFPWSTELHANIGERIIENLVYRMIQEPGSFGTFSRVEILVSKAGDALTSPQADVILSGIMVEMLTREQILNLLERRTAFQQAEKWPEFRSKLLQILLNEDLKRKVGWQFTVSDLDLLRSLIDISSLSSAEQNSIRLRLEVGVRSESAATVAGEVAEFATKVLPSTPSAEKPKLFTQLVVGRAEGPFTPTPPPVPTSVC